MLRTVLMAFFSLAVGYIILVVLIDGVLQDSFPAMIISLLMKFGMSQTEADRVYGTVFMQNKGLFVAVGFIILFLIFFYLAMSKVTRYLNSIGTEIETILSNSEAPVTLEPELRPISEKLNTLKMTLKRREYEAVESEQRKNGAASQKMEEKNEKIQEKEDHWRFYLEARLSGGAGRFLLLRLSAGDDLSGI